MLLIIAACILLYFMVILWKNLTNNSGAIFILPGLDLIVKIFTIYKSLINIVLLPINKVWKKSETAVEVPKLPSMWEFLWNFVLCPNKVQDYKLLMGSFFFQTLNGFSMLNLKEKIGRIPFSRFNYILLFHPETVQEVLKSQTLINKDFLYSILEPWLGDCLLISSDETWRKRRKILTPAFHFRILEEFQDAFNEHSNILIEKLKKMNKNDIFDITKIIKLCIFDIIYDTTMKVRLNAQTQKDNEYIKAVEEMQFCLSQCFMKPWYWIPSVLKFSSMGRNMKKYIEIIHRFDKKIIQKRKETALMKVQNEEDKNNYKVDEEELGLKKRRVFLDLLLEYHEKDNSFTERNIRQEVDLFMLAGEDTSTVSISWTLYFLGRHLDVQEKVFQELNDIFGENINRTITNEDLRKMKYLECVIKESLRLCPPVTFSIRKCPKGMTIGKYVLPANSSLMVCIYSIHHNPTVYENPEVFDPDRFLPENSKMRHPFAFIPFSAGPRNCIGQVFAMAEMKTVVANIIRHFKVSSLDPRDKILLTFDVALHPISGLRMTIEEREKSE